MEFNFSNPVVGNGPTTYPEWVFELQPTPPSGIIETINNQGSAVTSVSILGTVDNRGVTIAAKF